MTTSAPDRERSTATFEYRMPSLGADMDVGRVVSWSVAVGDEVHRGDVVAVVETEKSDIDIEIWHDGIVEEFLVEIGEEVDVGTPIAVMRHLGEDGEEPSPPAPPTAAAPEPGLDGPPPPGRPVPPPSAAPERPLTPTGDRVLASPLARRIAAERGVELDDVTGTGPSGAVTAADVERALSVAAQPSAASAPTAPERAAPPVDRMRALIAERMSTSNREIPHYYLDRDVDMSALLAWLEEVNQARPIAERLLPAALYLKAVATAAAKHPELNGYWVDGAFVPGEAVNVAMAVSMRSGGLVTPKIASTDERTVDEIMSSLREFVAAARTGALRSSWMSDATITLTNLGDNGADRVAGVISPPQVALVGMGRTSARPWVVDDELVIRPVMTVTLVADHRATDGVSGSRFLATLAAALERPDFELTGTSERSA